MVPIPEIDPNSEPVRSLVITLDLCGTFAFAISGSMAGVRQRLDMYGVLVIGFVTATFGGLSRDLMIGAVPPAALVDWRYLAVSLAAGTMTFFFCGLIEKLRNPVRLLDAAGLAFFCVAGAEKALAFGLSPVMAALLGMVTGVGGGMLRDILLAEIPAVLRRDFYAVAALLGAGIVVVGDLLGFPVVLTAVTGGLACFALRLVAIRRGWHLPVSPGEPPPPAGGA